MRALFLFGLLKACGSTWTLADTGAYVETEEPYNLCEDLLNDLGYPMVIQADLSDPHSFTILYREEPEERLCGGMVVDTGSGEVWLSGMIQEGYLLDLLVPAKPPDEFQVFSWGLEDVPSDPDDVPDENRIYWAGTDTTAGSASFVDGAGETIIWTREDREEEGGETNAYLVVQP